MLFLGGFHPFARRQLMLFRVDDSVVLPWKPPSQSKSTVGSLAFAELPLALSVCRKLLDDRVITHRDHG